MSLFFSLLAPSTTFADGFSSYSSEQDKLKQSVIKDVGEAERVNVPNPRTYAKDTTVEAIKINDRCFEPFGYLWGTWSYGKKAAMLLMDQNKNFKIALIESEGSYTIKVEVITVTELDCTDTSTGDPRIDLKKQMDDYQRRQDEYLKEINRLKGTN